MNIALGIFLGIIIFISWVQLFNFFNSLSNYFSMKETSEKNKNTAISKHSDELLDYNKKYEATINAIKLMSVLVETEISLMIAAKSRISQPYKSQNLDDDSEEIANKVYEGLKKEIFFGNPNILITDEYLLKYITEYTITSLMTKTFEYNSALLGTAPVDRNKTS